METLTPRIRKAIDIFLDAISDGTLAKGTCTACAVGNLVADGMGAKISVVDGDFQCDKENKNWSNLFVTDSRGQQRIRGGLFTNIPILKQLQEHFKKGEDVISTTDFNEKELAKIEFIFETNTQIHFQNYDKHSKQEIREDQIKGLEAVVKVMMTFDKVTEEVKDVFTKKAELIEIV